MGTKPLDIGDMLRPNRRIGDVVRMLVACPLCQVFPDGRQHLQIRVIAYRATSWRLECPQCGLRFSLDPDTFLAAINRGKVQGHPAGNGDVVRAVASAIINAGEF